MLERFLASWLGTSSQQVSQKCKDKRAKDGQYTCMSHVLRWGQRRAQTVQFASLLLPATHTFLLSAFAHKSFKPKGKPTPTAACCFLIESYNSSRSLSSFVRCSPLYSCSDTISHHFFSKLDRKSTRLNSSHSCAY